MARHSKHANDRSHYSHAERKLAGYAGNRKETLGTDCFLPFGHCCISLKVPKDPVVTPDGYLFDRECILEYLLRQKVELTAEAKKFEEQERRKDVKAAGEKRAEVQKEIDDFANMDRGIFNQADVRHGVKRTSEGGDDRGGEKKLHKGELLVIDKSKMAEKSFWAAQTTQKAAPAELKKVDTTARCPMSGKKLRAKDLLSVKFEVTDQKMMDKGGDKGMYCCAVSKRSITHQQAVVIKPSGIVILEKVCQDLVLKDMRCPITGKKLKGKEDILKMQIAGTGFSSHNEVVATSFRHIRSWGGDARTQQGHLPKAGYCGLH